MKLLLDQNLSHRLLDDTGDDFPGSVHIKTLNMERASDTEIWLYAQNNSYVIVTRDSDFHELSLMGKESPKVLWLKCGNVSTDRVGKLLRDGKGEIERFGADPAMVCLELY